MAKQEEWHIIYEHWGALHQMTVHCKCQWRISFMQIQNLLLFFFFFLNFYLFPYSSSEKLNHQSGWWMNKALFISWGLEFSNNTAYLQNYTAFKNIYKTIDKWLTIKDWLITKITKKGKLWNHPAHVTQTHLLLCAEIVQTFGGSSGLLVGRLNTLSVYLCVQDRVCVCMV